MWHSAPSLHDLKSTSFIYTYILSLNMLFFREKKQRAQVTGNASGTVCKEKKDSSIAADDVENRDEPTEQCDKDNASKPGMERYASKKLVISGMFILLLLL